MEESQCHWLKMIEMMIYWVVAVILPLYLMVITILHWLVSYMIYYSLLASSSDTTIVLYYIYVVYSITSSCIHNWSYALSPWIELAYCILKDCTLQLYLQIPIMRVGEVPRKHWFQRNSNQKMVSVISFLYEFYYICISLKIGLWENTS